MIGALLSNKFINAFFALPLVQSFLNTKYQIKYLTSNRTSVGEWLTEMRFGNLVVGQKYRLHISQEAAASSGTALAGIVAYNNDGTQSGVNPILVTTMLGGGSTSIAEVRGNQIIFTAVDTFIEFNFFTNGAGARTLYAGNNRTYAMLEKLNYHEETTDFNP